MMKTTDPPVQVTEVFDHPLSRVWQAITTHEQMIEWYFEQLPDFMTKKGFTTAFAVCSETRTFTHIWEVLEVIAEKRISYSWKYKEYPGAAVLTMEISPAQQGTQLTVTHRTTSDFPDEVPEFKRESCLEGWKYFISERLKAYLK